MPKLTFRMPSLESSSWEGLQEFQRSPFSARWDVFHRYFLLPPLPGKPRKLQMFSILSNTLNWYKQLCAAQKLSVSFLPRIASIQIRVPSLPDF